MRKLFILSFFLPLITWGQSSLPPCPETGVKNSCIGVVPFQQGILFFGEIRDNLPGGVGVLLRQDGSTVVSGYIERSVVVRSRANLRDDERLLLGQVEKAIADIDQRRSIEGKFVSNLPPCPQSGRRDNCFGKKQYKDGEYEGDWKDDKAHGTGRMRLALSSETPNAVEIYEGKFSNGSFQGLGRFTFADGRTYVGGFVKGKRQGEGILYSATGAVLSAGAWRDNELSVAIPIDTNIYPFDKVPKTQIAQHSTSSQTPPAIPPVDPGKVERDRLTAEVEAERKKRQELDSQRIAEIQAERKIRQDLEQKLAEAEAKERERQQAPQAQRPQGALRNERRLALVIGNSSYKVSPLDNPANDANDVAESLKKFGFQTTLVRNATLGQMREATRKFADQLPSADVALIYFAGHGIESNRKNYMIPVNADLKFEYELADQGYDAGIWLEMLESIKSNNADRVNIVILDACRNNSLIGSRNQDGVWARWMHPQGRF